MLNSFYFTTKLIKNNNTIVQLAKSGNHKILSVYLLLFNLLISIIFPNLVYSQTKSDCMKVYTNSFESIKNNKSYILELINVEDPNIIRFNIVNSYYDYKNSTFFLNDEIKKEILKKHNADSIDAYYRIQESKNFCSKKYIKSLCETRRKNFRLHFTNICWEYNFLIVHLEIDNNLLKEAVTSGGQELIYMIIFNEKLEVVEIKFKQCEIQF